VSGVQKPDPLTDPLPLNDSCRHPVVYIETRCCHTQPPQAPKPPPVLGQVRPFPVPSLNGHQVTPTQLLPTVKPGTPEAPEAVPRHRVDDDEDGTNMKDILLGSLIGAAVAIFVVGLLLILLLR
jgi:hypothetical protein